MSSILTINKKLVYTECLNAVTNRKLWWSTNYATGLDANGVNSNAFTSVERTNDRGRKEGDTAATKWSSTRAMGTDVVRPPTQPQLLIHTPCGWWKAKFPIKASAALGVECIRSDWTNDLVTRRIRKHTHTNSSSSSSVQIPLASNLAPPTGVSVSLSPSHNALLLLTIFRLIHNHSSSNSRAIMHVHMITWSSGYPVGSWGIISAPGWS